MDNVKNIIKRLVEDDEDDIDWKELEPDLQRKSPAEIADEPCNRYGHPDYPASDWKFEVMHGYTDLNYREWLIQCLETEQNNLDLGFRS